MRSVERNEDTIVDNNNDSQEYLPEGKIGTGHNHNYSSDSSFCSGHNVGYHDLNCMNGYSPELFYANCSSHNYGHHSETCLTYGSKGDSPTYRIGARFTGPRW